MRWAENNPVAVVMASACGLLLLVSVALAWVWSRPASSGVQANTTLQEFESEVQQPVSDIGPITDYRVVTERPLFESTRQPVVSIDGEGLEMDEMLGDVADAPDVTLTGVVITPERKMVTLRPASSGESLIAVEGEPLEGDYFGWTVSEINPRSIVLASSDGENLELDLQINTRKIEEPPEPEPAADPGAADAQGEAVAEEDDEPLSRAEEIRQRIAERREELRKQAESNAEGAKPKPSSASAYQSAIQNMINRNTQKDKEDEKEKEDGSDG